MPKYAAASHRIPRSYVEHEHPGAFVSLPEPSLVSWSLVNASRSLRYAPGSLSYPPGSLVNASGYHRYGPGTLDYPSGSLSNAFGSIVMLRKPFTGVRND